MGPYTCIADNCGKRTLNDSHLCDEHDPDQQPGPEDDEPDDQDATPLIEDDDPDDYITDPPGGES